MLSLFDMPHEEARRALASGAPAYLLVNPVEYHGPHLSLHNDRLVSRGLIEKVHERLVAHRPDWPLLMADDLEIGVDPVTGPGTRPIPYSMVVELVRGACRALLELGAQRVVLMTFHGSPLHNLALQAGVDWLRQRHIRALAPLNEMLREMITLDDPWRFADALAPIADEAERTRMAETLALDFHAGFFETSMALHLAPHSVSPRYRELPPCPAVHPDPALLRASAMAAKIKKEMLARELRFAAYGVGWNQLRPFPGYTGAPHLASAESGAAFTEHVLLRFEQLLLDVLVGDAPPPEPIMRWMERLTAGGRIFGLPQPSLDEILDALPLASPDERPLDAQHSRPGAV